MNIDLSNIKYHVQPHFQFLWKYTKRSMIICTGGRGSGKTTSIIQELIAETFQDDNNVLIVRGTYASHKDTTFQEFLDWITIFGLDQFFESKVSPLEITNIVTGAKIYFRGCDNVGKIKGIKKVKTVFFDESNIGITEQDIRTIKFSMRGQKIKNIKYIMAYNPINPFLCPWKKYIDDPDKYNVLHFHSTYLDNPFNGEQYIKEFELLKETNPTQYKVDGLGEYGVYEDSILDVEKIKKITQAQFNNRDLRRCYEGLGVDFGTTHPMTFSHTLYDEKNNDLYILKSIGESNLTTMKFIRKYLDKLTHLMNIPNKFADAEDKGGRIELNDEGWKFKATYKIDMELTFIEWFNNLNHCYILDGEADGFESNVASWIWKKGKPDNKNEDYVDSVRYSLEPIIKSKLNKGKPKRFNHKLYV